MVKLGLVRMVCAVSVFWVAAADASPAQTFTTLASFDHARGFDPLGPLVQGANGGLYGTDAGGGGNHNNGAVFKISPAGLLTKLYSFCSQTNCTDGAIPEAALILAADGNFYGTTTFGGVNNGGTFFEITPAGKLTTLYSFCDPKTNCADGEYPHGLVQVNENFYGTTSGGGAHHASGGTVFEITPAGELTTVYSFCAQTNSKDVCTDGYGPSGLVFSDGNFYGITYLGGSKDYGTVFELTPAGELTTLHNFCLQTDCVDGAFPSALGLVQGADGNFYGTTYEGGANGNNGSVFEITPAGKLTTLYSFCAVLPGCTDGTTPNALMQATDGNFYGTTVAGGANGGNGTAFEITPAGKLTTLYVFCSQANCADGASPRTGLVQATNGIFYGTTYYGGAGESCEYGCGVVFSLSVGLGPFVETVPTSRRVGGAVTILGNNLTDATGVSFNGSPATFTVVLSGSAIKTTVPAGATTGTVEVTTHSGTLTSNVPFQVEP